ncbi:phytanoyl-CoA dioxygenase family protein [Viridibacterium curvum]|uniref:Phytanoyl-CoA dioxygenase n=1 Tax=Viridibacterium curvum TaxID=1101404 RepID=A0ABP9QLI5_9RHOO
MHSILESVKESPGFTTGLRLSDDDLVLVKNAISEHLANHLARIEPDKVPLLQTTALDMYHTIAGQLPHDKLLTRQSRILAQTAVDAIRTTSLFRQLESQLGAFEISDEENVGRESISIRLVRPGFDTDVGSLHADDWFWKLYDFPVPTGKRRVKIWIAICCEQGKSGLILCPNSHKRDWDYSVIERAGMSKPLLSPDENPDKQIFQSKPGDAVVFNYDLLHGGMVTRGERTRVSMEFTMLIPEDVYQH